MGGEAVPCLIEFLDDKDPEYRQHCAAVLGKIGPAAAKAAPELTRLLHDGHAEVRSEAATALWKIEKSDAGLPVLIELLEDAHCDTQAASGLGDMGPAAKTALPGLKKLEDRLASAGQNSDLYLEWVREAIDKIKTEDDR